MVGLDPTISETSALMRFSGLRFAPPENDDHYFFGLNATITSGFVSRCGPSIRSMQ